MNVVIFIMVFYAAFSMLNKRVKISEVLYNKYAINNRLKQFMFSVVAIIALVIFTALAMALNLGELTQQLLIGIITGFYFAMNSGLARHIYNK